MSILVGNPFLLNTTAATGYQVSRSLRFNSADSAYLSRTPASAGTRTTYTLSVWVKRAALTTRQMIFSANNGGDSDAIYFHEDNTLRFFQRDGLDSSLITTQVFRDASAWYHIVLAVDTTQGTSSNRVKLYVNGTQVTTFSTASYPSSSYTGGINNTVAHNIGRRSSASDNYLDAYLADAWFLDGIAATPSDFAETDATTGQWIPKTYSGSKGSNGFHLEFADNSAATAAALGKDTSGNGLNWTPNNFSVTAGAGNDALTDSPTSYGTGTSGGDVRGNFCTWNPLDNAGLTLSNGNLQTDNTVSAYYSCRGTIKLPSTGKWYFETTVGNPVGAAVRLGVGTAGGATEHFVGVDATQLYTIHPGGSRTYSTSITGAGAVLSVAYDADSQKLWFGFNNSWLDGSTGLTGNPAAGTNPTYTSILDVFPTASQYSASNVNANFGQRAFAYTPPANYKALVDTNLPSPSVAKPNTVFDVALYSGNDTTQTITLPGAFSPDLVWLKPRNAAINHALFDIVRGATKRLISNLTNAEDTVSAVTAFNSNGWSMGGDYNSSGTTYVGWAWDAGTSTVTNNVGSITSSVRANASAGFSIVTYSGNATSGATIGHGLGVAPSLIITKSRTAPVAGQGWQVGHASLGWTKRLYLETTNAAMTTAGAWNNTAPTSTVFTAGNSDLVNDTGYTYVAYCFAAVTGYSSAFSYTGTGNSDGPMIWLGFKPRLILLKRSDSANNWILVDTARDTYNSARYQLLPNVSDSEYTVVDTLDVLSNGFKVRDTNASRNASGGTYIGFAWAENPFQYARAR